MGSGYLRIEGLSKSFVPAKPVFADVSFTLDRGEFVCIIGHSGCGKTTVLNVLAGLDTASGGNVFMDGREVAGPSLERFAIQPKMLLLDEPFGALDALMRGTIQDELMSIVRQTHQTVFMITHDVDEAILLADRILLMSNGTETEAGWRPGNIAETVVNPLPRDRTCARLHHLGGYYALRNRIVDFLVMRANS